MRVVWRRNNDQINILALTQRHRLALDFHARQRRLHLGRIARGDRDQIQAFRGLNQWRVERLARKTVAD